MRSINFSKILNNKVLHDFYYYFIFYLYFIVTFFIYFIAPIFIKIMVLMRIEDRVRWKERIFPTYDISGNSIKKNVLWFHVSSIGELNSIKSLLYFFNKKYNHYTLLITSYTKTSASIFKDLGLSNAIHQYAPLDSPQSVTAFLKLWKPHFAVFVESEIWPILLLKTSKICPIIMLNARFSKKGWKRWQLIKPVFIRLLKLFDQIITCSKKDLDNIVSLDTEYFAQKTHFFCNIKYFSNDIAFDPKEYEYLRQYLKKKRILVCASTHGEEERQLMVIHANLKQQIQQMLTIIVPRHSSRSHAIIHDAKRLKLNGILYSQYSHLSNKFNESNNITIGNRVKKVCNESSYIKYLENLDILVVDSIGKLGIFYRLADSIFVGGSLVPHGGQNVLEPLQLGKSVTIGRYYNNFTDIVETAVNKGILKIALNTEELLLNIKNDLAIDSNHNLKPKINDNIRTSILAIKTKNFDKICTLLERYI